LFRQENLQRASAFFDRYGARSILLARFVPIVRTFTPIVAGASGMHYRRFVAYNAIGGVAWGCGVTILGYFLGQIAFVKSNIELILVAIVAVSVIPVVVEFLRNRRRVPTG
jgi:membrane-associated protein